MEDAHIASPGFSYDSNAPISVFGVFDGHGGKLTTIVLSIFLSKSLMFEMLLFQFYRQRSFEICEVKILRSPESIACLPAWGVSGSYTSIFP
jgi:serine/threonine protein phosphatase PrpC